MTAHIHPADTPFVRIFIDGQDIGAVPNSIKSFRYRDSAGVADEAEFVLFDPTFEELEDAILASIGKPIEFEFGWARGDKSPRIQANLFSYVPSFDFGSGVDLTIKTIDASQKLIETVRSTWFEAGTPAHVVAEYYAKQFGLESVVEPALPITQRLYQENMTDRAFLETKVAPIARSAMTGLGGYRFFLQEGKILHFRTDSFVLGRRTHRFEFRPDGKSQAGVIQNWSPNFQAPVMRALGGGGVKVVSFDPIEKKSISSTADNASMQGRPSEGRKIQPDSETPRIVRQPFFNVDDAKGFAQRKYQLTSSMSYQATLTTYGNPQLTVTDICEVIVRTPSGKMHYTSGRYFVREVVHQIDASGSYTSEINLQRQGALEGGEASKGAQVQAPPPESPQAFGERPVTRRIESRDREDIPRRTSGFGNPART